MESEPSLSHLTSFAAAILAPAAALESGGVRWGETREGVVQGGVPSGGLFCIGIHPSVSQLDRDCREGGGLARAGADDVLALGPADVVLPAVRRFEEEVRTRCGLRLQWNKTQVFSWDGDLPPDAHPLLTLAGETVDGVFERGFMCYGIPIGTDNFVRAKLQEKAEESH